jgi:hypothetical protein
MSILGARNVARQSNPLSAEEMALLPIPSTPTICFFLYGSDVRRGTGKCHCFPRDIRSHKTQMLSVPPPHPALHTRARAAWTTGVVTSWMRTGRQTVRAMSQSFLRQSNSHNWLWTPLNRCNGIDSSGSAPSPPPSSPERPPSRHFAPFHPRSFLATEIVADMRLR